VNEVVDSSSLQYAVIAGLRTETGPERLVIAYANEELLRDLIAGSSIIAVGFSSREEAAASSRASVPAAISHLRMPDTSAGRETERYPQNPNRTERRADTGLTLWRLTRFFATSYSHVATAIIAIFFSRNAVSAVIRMAMGSSV